VYVALSGAASIAVIDVSGTPELLRTLPTGNGTKPHVLAVSPDRRTLWSTVQGMDPKVVSFELGDDGEGAMREYRYDLVPRVVFATNTGAYFTAHHSTGLHHVSLADGKVTTPYVGRNGQYSEARKQIEGVAVDPSGTIVALTHEGRRVATVLYAAADGSLIPFYETRRLSANPYWVTFDPSGYAIYVSIPGSQTVEAYDITSFSSRPVWTLHVGGAVKRMTTRDPR
jgi:DNA-binding beta-propeller fold protein YncE